jgi:hypothetical protein
MRKILFTKKHLQNCWNQTEYATICGSFPIKMTARTWCDDVCDDGRATYLLEIDFLANRKTNS